MVDLYKRCISSLFQHRIQHIPYGDDVADGASQDKEMEDAVHVPPFVDTIKQGTCDITDTLGHNPYHCSCRHIVNEWFKSYEHT